MRLFRIGLTLGGVLAVIVGVLWVGQGTGWFPYPARSFMVADMAWAWRGAVLSVAGVLAILFSWRL